MPTPVDGNGGAYIADLPTVSTQYYSDTKPYSETLYESSSLSRVVGAKKPGNAWHSHPSQVEYVSNIANDVYSFSVYGNTIVCSYYAPNTLYVTKQVDEDGKTFFEYKDKLGRVVLIRRMNGSQPVNTYYVYDEMNRLRYVLPPLCSDQLEVGGAYSPRGNLLKNAYQYFYNERGNVIEKKLPDCEPVYMVYDRTDRLILTQDGNMRVKNQWSIIKYDVYGRVVYTGILNRNATRESLQSTLSGLRIIESYTGTTSFHNTGYTCNYFINEVTPLVVNYYDTYSFINLLPSADVRSNLTYNLTNGYGEQYSNSKGMLTGQRVYTLDNRGDYLTDAIYYDVKGQEIQRRSTNLLGGYEKKYHQYNYVGQITKTQKKHYSMYGNHTEVYSYAYDHANRLIQTNHQVEGQNEVEVSYIEYDELGRVKKDKLHNKTATKTYNYNLQGNVTSIVAPGLSQSISYNSNSSQYYNGNISRLITNSIVNFLFYDGLNRLTGANNLWGNPSIWMESRQYDKNGNIIYLNRYDGTSTQLDRLSFTYQGNQVKKITDAAGSQYQYTVKEYQDLANQPTEFYYDPNGNLTADLDRNIVSIRYNVLNLPDTIQFSNGHQIINRYTADGIKHMSTYHTALTTVAIPLGSVCQWVYSLQLMERTRTYYCGNAEYEESGTGIVSLQRIGFGNGYIRNNTYYYTITDYLGNISSVWNGTSNLVEQQTTYYPSGLPHRTSTNANLQRYKYNGKELITNHGYDQYDYHARGYYPAIMRFTSVDPHAERYPNASPYSYVENNPIMRIDPDGKDWYYKVVDNVSYLYYDSSIKGKEAFEKTGMQNAAYQYIGEVGTATSKYKDETLLQTTLNKDGTFSVKMGDKEAVKITNQADSYQFEQTETINGKIISATTNVQNMDNVKESTLKGDSPYEKNTIFEEIGEAATCEHCLNVIQSGMQGMQGSPSMTKSAQTLMAAKYHNSHQTHKRKIHKDEEDNRKK